ncbi:hypothetical protein [Providencia burhodogranariea]|uniref:fimbrial biogenesis chaperone n=1 Tax=Providencia burhodogranariea TaxID=516074 RepID=UPI000A024BF0
MEKNKNRALNLTIDNPTKYVASLSGVTLSGIENNKLVTFELDEIRHLTLLPKSSKTFPIELRNSNIQSIEYWLIDDQGKFFNQKKKLVIDY